MSEVTFNHFDTVPWVDETKKKAVPAEVIAEAAKAGARRKMLAQGETGIYVQYSELPAGFRIDAHAHSHDEVITLISGSCTVDGGTTMGALTVVDLPCLDDDIAGWFDPGPCRLARQVEPQ